MTDVWTMTDEEFAIYIGPDDAMKANAILVNFDDPVARTAAALEAFGKKGPEWVARTAALIAKELDRTRKNAVTIRADRTT